MNTTTPMKSPGLRGAFLCGLIPLLLGTAIFAAWYFTQKSWLEIAGLWLIPAGLLSILAGSFLVWRHSKHRARNTPEQGRRWPLPMLLIAALFLSNFVAAAFYTLAAMEIMTRYTVRIHNLSGQMVQGIVLQGPGVELELPPLDPAEHTIHYLHFSGDGPLLLYRPGQNPETHTIESYVTHNLQGDRTVRFLKDGSCEILETTNTFRTPTAP